MRGASAPRLYYTDPKPYSLSYGHTLSPILIQTIARRKRRAVFDSNSTSDHYFKNFDQDLTNFAQYVEKFGLVRQKNSSGVDLIT